MIFDQASPLRSWCGARGEGCAAVFGDPLGVAPLFADLFFGHVGNVLCREAELLFGTFVFEEFSRGDANHTYFLTFVFECFAGFETQRYFAAVRHQNNFGFSSTWVLENIGPFGDFTSGGQVSAIQGRHRMARENQDGRFVLHRHYEAARLRDFIGASRAQVHKPLIPRTSGTLPMPRFQAAGRVW